MKAAPWVLRRIGLSSVNDSADSKEESRNDEMASIGRTEVDHDHGRSIHDRAAGGNQTRFAARDLVEFGVAYGLILAAIWTLNPWQRFFYWAAIAWIVVTTWQRRTTWKALGLGLTGLAAVALDRRGCSDTWRPGGLSGRPGTYAAPAPWPHSAVVACLGVPDLGGDAAVPAADLFPASVAAHAAR